MCTFNKYLEGGVGVLVLVVVVLQLQLVVLFAMIGL